MLAKSEGDVHGLRAGAWVSLVSWLLCAPWEGAVLLWKKSAVLSESFRGEIIWNSFSSGILFCDPAAAPGAAAELCVSCTGRCSGHAPAAPQQSLKGWFSWAWVQEVAQPGLGAGSKPSSCCQVCAWLGAGVEAPAWQMGADVSAFSPLVPLPFQPQSVRAARLQGSAECGFGCFWCFAGTHGGSFP